MREVSSVISGRVTIVAIIVALALVPGASDGVAAAPRARVPRQDTAFDSTAITPAMVNAGRSIFREKGLCFACHGAELEGTQVAPTLKAHAWRDAKNGDLPEILRIVSKGVSSTAMVGYPGGISPTEARAVAAYVWSVGKGKAKP